MTESFQPRRGLLICLGLTVLVVGVYWPVGWFEFTNLDDPVYVTDNPHVRAGLTWAGVQWALGSWEAEFWHPLTWLTHMADVELYGLKAGGHHMTNLLLHLANTLLVFVAFRRLTGAVWRSGLLAGGFGVHPLHVETVAWVADRKDVLSAVFWWLTVWGYARYVEASKAGSGKGWRWYGLGLVFFTLGLLSKPMVVTLPFVLLLLDVWPLRRWELSTRRTQLAVLGRLVWEKVPYWVVTVGGSVLAYVVQERGGGLVSVAQLTVWERVSNAVVSYVRYLGKTVWPSHLAVYYPHPGTWPLGVVLGSGLVLVAITGLVVIWRRTRPYMAVGWLWYLGTLVPVIGLVQIGGQAMADRYTYVPLIGVFIALAWGIPEFLAGWRFRQLVLRALGGAVVLALS